MATEKTFPVEVPDIGTFTFRKRTIGLQAKIENDALRSLGGPALSDDLRSVVLALQTLSVLTVTAPEGWDVDTLDPLDADDIGKLWKVHGGLRDAEEKFRAGAGA